MGRLKIVLESDQFDEGYSSKDLALLLQLVAVNVAFDTDSGTTELPFKASWNIEEEGE
jgi:hypothetical protein